MTGGQDLRLSSALGATALCLLHAAPVSAASLELVPEWGASGVPETVSMYRYVPDDLATPAPVVVLVHYCGGSAAAVFGQAQGGGLVAAADTHGFILVVPQAENQDGTGRCWDVGSAAALTRGGGGDTEAIYQMVEHTLQEFDANADRVYITGTSSGGMTTQALLALYPDVFKAGSAMAGVPAGCWAVDNPGGGWSGPCAGGSVTHTPEEWGEIARDLHPGHSGYRPRVQLFHGDADDIISYQNHLEALAQWTNVLGLDETPTSTDTLLLGAHQATRQTWHDDCGHVALDAFTSQGGDHGPSDALFLAEHLIPFFGLDDPGAIDPHVAACGEPPVDGTGGSDGGGGGSANATGGTSAGGTSAGGMPGSAGGTSGTDSSSGAGANDTSRSSSGGGCAITGRARPTPAMGWALVALLLARATRRLLPRHARHRA